MDRTQLLQHHPLRRRRRLWCALPAPRPHPCLLHVFCAMPKSDHDFCLLEPPETSAWSSHAHFGRHKCVCKVGSCLVVLFSITAVRFPWVSNHLKGVLMVRSTKAKLRQCVKDVPLCAWCSRTTTALLKAHKRDYCLMCHWLILGSCTSVMREALCCAQSTRRWRRSYC